MTPVVGQVFSLPSSVFVSTGRFATYLVAAFILLMGAPPISSCTRGDTESSSSLFSVCSPRLPCSAGPGLHRFGSRSAPSFFLLDFSGARPGDGSRRTGS